MFYINSLGHVTAVNFLTVAQIKAPFFSRPSFALRSLPFFSSTYLIKIMRSVALLTESLRAASRALPAALLTRRMVAQVGEGGQGIFG